MKLWGPSICIFLAIMGLSQVVSAQNIPDKFHGVWKVLSAFNNGVEETLPANPEAGIEDAELDLLELIIQDNRMVHVRCDGEGMVCKTKILGALRGEDGNAIVKFAYRPFGWDSRRDDDTVHGLMTFEGEQLKIAFFSSDSNANRISTQAGDEQWVLTLKRLEPDK